MPKVSHCDSDAGKVMVSKKPCLMLPLTENLLICSSLQHCVLLQDVAMHNVTTVDKETNTININGALLGSD